MTTQSKLSFIAGVLFTLLFCLLPYHFYVISSHNSGGQTAASSMPAVSSSSGATPAPESEAVESSSEDTLTPEATSTPPPSQPLSQPSYSTPTPTPYTPATVSPTPFNNRNSNSARCKMQADYFRMLAQQMDDKIRRQQDSVRMSSDRMGKVPSVTATMEYNAAMNLLHEEERIRDGYLNSAQQAEAQSQQ